MEVEDKEKGLTVNEALEGWQDMGYPSRADAMRDAALLWKSLKDAGYIRTKEMGQRIARNPKLWILGYMDYGK